MEFIDNPGIHAAGQGGIGIVCNDEVSLSVFQELCAFNGSLVDDLDMGCLEIPCGSGSDRGPGSSGIWCRWPDAQGRFLGRGI
mgnify:CR=1 FL=1